MGGQGEARRGKGGHSGLSRACKGWTDEERGREEGGVIWKHHLSLNR